MFVSDAEIRRLVKRRVFYLAEIELSLDNTKIADRVKLALERLQNAGRLNCWGVQLFSLSSANDDFVKVDLTRATDTGPWAPKLDWAIREALEAEFVQDNQTAAEALKTGRIDNELKEAAFLAFFKVAAKEGVVAHA